MHTVTKQSDRFQIDVDGEQAGLTQFVDTDQQKRVFFHTEVDDAFAGQGLAAELVREALDATRAEGLSIVAVCPYVRAYVKKHDDWADIVVPAGAAELAAIPR
ncbi:GNAT family N-acetyltransferase [Agrococcus sp. ARC_14]|uniref:GNAT family N-acetyltransferase n=1 Tax=Agrococcus sp. ARC_14 TaxID=2919927 RepID=UPI001F05E7BF|nr:N-acetyltransferase [Agrococcus sp. ARC_14]